MKGNEARVIFFLHSVDQLKDGQVSKVKPLSVGVRFLLFFGLLGLGVLVYVLLEFGVERRSQKGLVSTAEVSSDTTTKSPVIPWYDEDDTTAVSEGITVTERNIKFTTNLTTEYNATVEAEATKETTFPGI